jgi:uncharacterized protein
MRPSIDHHFQPLPFKQFWQRARGLLLRERLLDTTGVLIEPCRAIHTIGMRRSIDVIFLDRRGWVREIRSHVKPYRMVMSGFTDVFSVVEFASGTCEKRDIQVGDRLVYL